MLELLPSSALKRVTIDFEKAIWMVLRELLPNVEIQGCVFHWTQALWKRLVMEQEICNHVVQHHHFFAKTGSLIKV